MHTHGMTFRPEHDGAFPLSPEDPNQPVGAESVVWESVGVTDKKKGDRVPPHGTFEYTWETINWPTTANVWLYHDHSVCDHINTSLGAIGMLVVHNPDDDLDVLSPDFSSGDALIAQLPNNSHIGNPLIINADGSKKFLAPPKVAQYLQFYHNLDGQEHYINGRQYLGNTPTLIGGIDTVMRFGVASIGNAMHTFHIHGHRWVIPGPSGIAGLPGSMQNGIQNIAASQFEDTRIMGPANSFAFTIKEGTFMGANTSKPPMRPIGIKGEWHMHCHVGHHMAHGMMGSLLIVDEDDQLKLSNGFPCPHMNDNHDTPDDENTNIFTIDVVSMGFNPEGVTGTTQPYEIIVPTGAEIIINFIDDTHSFVISENLNNIITSPIPSSNVQNSGTQLRFTVEGLLGNSITYECGPHPFMRGIITIGT